MQSIENMFVNNIMHSKIGTINLFILFDFGIESITILIFMKKVQINPTHPRQNIKCLIF